VGKLQALLPEIAMELLPTSRRKRMMRSEKKNCFYDLDVVIYKGSGEYSAVLLFRV
jgi:hypothetical protein